MKLLGWPFFVLTTLALLTAGCGPLGDSGGLAGKNFFVTSQTFSGNLNGIAGADLKCQLAATAGGLQGTYKAWLSTYFEDFSNRLSVSYPLRTPTGLDIFMSRSNLVSGLIVNPPNRDEYGNLVPTPQVWTNTDSIGLGLQSDCGGWTTDSAAQSGGYGLANSTAGSAWTQAGFAGCSNQYRLYCLEQ